MRFYRIVITDPTSGAVVTPPGFAGLLDGASYTSFVNNQSLPGALDLELDIPIIGAATPQGFGLLRIWGISLREIGQANQLGFTAGGQSGQSKAGKNIQIFGGMQRGLPLANPQQNGLLFSGQIVQAFGNWINQDQTLDMVVMPGVSTSGDNGGVGSLAQPKNLVLNWKAGTPLAGALQTCLSTAFPNYRISINITAKITKPTTQTGFFPSLEQLAQYVLAVSRDVVKTANYPGVTILPPTDGKTISVFDTASSGATGAAAGGGASAKQINYQDLIGQPTWLEGGAISIKTVMRADLKPGDAIMLPPTIVTNTQQSFSSLLNQSLAFQGGFTIISGRHVGHFRQPSADSWVSVFDAAPNPGNVQGT